MTAGPDLRPFLVTGGAGFIGCNLVDRLCRSGEQVIVYDLLSRPGVERNCDWLRAEHGDRVEVRVADIRDGDTLGASIAQAKGVFHFAAQVAVTTSLLDPADDFSINLAGTFTLLETIRRHAPAVPLVFASTNKVYGNLNELALDHRRDMYLPQDATIREFGVGEIARLAFYTPYGCSKGAADQYVLDYAMSFGLRTAVMRMSCIYGPHQMGTEDQGWVAHFVKSAIMGDAISLFGDGHQVRDVLHVDDAVDAYLAAFANIDEVKGRAFNLGGGPANAISLVQLLAYIERLTGTSIERAFHDWRPGDQRWYVSDRRIADSLLGLAKPIAWRDGVADLVRWFAQAERRSPAISSVERALPVEALP